MGASIIQTLITYITTLVTDFIPEIPLAFQNLFFVDVSGTLTLNALGEVGLAFLALGIVTTLFYTFKNMIRRRR